MIPAYRERQCGSPSHLIAALYAPSGGVKVPPHGYMGSPPSGRSTLTPPASAAWSSAMRWEGEECVRITRGPITLSIVAATRTDPV